MPTGNSRRTSVYAPAANREVRISMQNSGLQSCGEMHFQEDQKQDTSMVGKSVVAVDRTASFLKTHQL